MSGVVHVKSVEEWEKALEESRKGKAMIVDFTAVWCGPCRMMAPVFEKLSKDFPDVAFLKVDVDELQEVAVKCGVRAMPTFIGYFNGAQVETFTGADQRKLGALVERLSSTAKGQ